jgi:Family of unknown function (DUF6011)
MTPSSLPSDGASRKPRAVHYKWVRSGSSRFDNVGILADGTLHNPNGYPAEAVREAVQAADERRRQRRSKAATKAAGTRRRRQENRVYDTAQRILEGRRLGPRRHCVICGKGLSDTESIERGIGSDCWQGVLAFIEA